jgi:ABC-type transport system involved in cytochrome c biogenesis permease subunit
VVSAGRSPDARPRDVMRLMAAAAGVVAVLAGVVGAARRDPQLVAVAVAFAALGIYLYARWRDVTGTGAPALVAAGVLACAAAGVWLAVTGYRLFAVCLAVPAAFGLLRLRSRRSGS